MIQILIFLRRSQTCRLSLASSYVWGANFSADLPCLSSQHLPLPEMFAGVKLARTHAYWLLMYIYFNYTWFYHEALMLLCEYQELLYPSPNTHTFIQVSVTIVTHPDSCIVWIYQNLNLFHFTAFWNSPLCFSILLIESWWLCTSPWFH